jgi:hypothetical protein
MIEEALANPDDGASTPTVTPASIINSPTPNAAAPQSWPDSWRQDMAGDDEKQLKQLERLNSPLDLGKSFFEAQKKISSFKPAVEKPGADSTSEQVAAYREAMGVPDEASGYNLDFEDGTVIGEDVKPFLDGYLKHAHESGMPPDAVKENVGWYLKDVASQKEALSEANDEARINGSAELRSEWGGEFQGNMNAIHSLFASAPEGTMEALMGSAGEDGLKWANNPDNIRWLVGIAKEANPQATLVPPGPDQAGSINTEIETLQKMMHSPDKVERDKYWGNDDLQKRFTQLNRSQKDRK